jgi:hypothetical protein
MSRAASISRCSVSANVCRCCSLSSCNSASLQFVYVCAWLCHEAHQSRDCSLACASFLNGEAQGKQVLFVCMCVCVHVSSHVCARCACLWRLRHHFSIWFRGFSACESVYMLWAQRVKTMNGQLF